MTIFSPAKFVVAAGLSCCFASAFLTDLVAAAEPLARSLDERVVIDCFAREPDIVTPTGLAVDARGRVLVIECHTHFRPAGYQGPASDRLRWLIDSDGDGKADEFSTFFEGTEATMGIAIGADGWVYVATRNEIFRLRDKNRDDVADERQQLVRLETPGNYPHNGLSGFAFDFRGGLYFGLGENLGAEYRLIGSDGRTLAGGGEGGNVYHGAADGSGIERIAAGFWNPFHMAVDPWERLFVVDNDPDSRPPCRLLHVVPGGDFGYRFRNGRKGLHPFTAWNGELPGTLPMVAGTGEAPSGVIVYASAALPNDYRGEVLVASWGDHRIDRFRLEPRGASFRSHAKPWITGGEDFRPVGIALAPDGSLYVSDWVDKSYELHGRGAVWHIGPNKKAIPDAKPSDTAKLPAAEIGQAAPAATWKSMVKAGALDRIKAQRFLADPSIDMQTLAVRTLPETSLQELAPWVRLLAAQQALPDELRAELLRRAPPGLDQGTLLAAAADDDRFVQSAALTGLRRTMSNSDLVRLAASPTPSERLAAALLLSRTDDPAGLAALPALLIDSAPEVRFAAIEWVASRKLAQFRDKLQAGLAAEGLTRQLFEGCLAALEQLDGKPVRDIAGQDAIAQLLMDEKLPPELRRRALRMLDAANPLVDGELLPQWLESDDAALRLEAVRTLRESTRNDRAARLLKIASDEASDISLRAAAIVGLSSADTDHRALLLELAVSSDAILRREALRSLRGAALTPEEQASLNATLETNNDAAAAALLGALVRPPDSLATDRGAALVSGGEKAAILGKWLTDLEGPADPAAGERIFFHPQGPLCFRCHQVDGRGGRGGPDLTNAAKSLTRERLIESIIDPSKEIAPQFVFWTIAKVDGATASGVLVAEGADGTQTFGDAEGRLFSLRPAEIAEKSPQPLSIMPAGLVQRMTAQEFRDLLAYLLERRE